MHRTYKVSKNVITGFSTETWGVSLLVGRYGIEVTFLCFWASWTR